MHPQRSKAGTHYKRSTWTRLWYVVYTQAGKATHNPVLPTAKRYDGGLCAWHGGVPMALFNVGYRLSNTPSESLRVPMAVASLFTLNKQVPLAMGVCADSAADLQRSLATPEV